MNQPVAEVWETQKGVFLSETRRELDHTFVFILIIAPLPCLFDLCSNIFAHLFGKPMCGKLSNGAVRALSWRSLLLSLGVLFVASSQQAEQHFAFQFILALSARMIQHKQCPFAVVIVNEPGIFYGLMMPLTYQAPA